MGDDNLECLEQERIQGNKEVPIHLVDTIMEEGHQVLASTPWANQKTKEQTLAQERKYKSEVVLLERVRLLEAQLYFPNL